MEQLHMFGAPQPEPVRPEGFRYAPDLITKEEEQDLLAWFQTLPLVPYMYEGYEAKRRIAYFGQHLNKENDQLVETPMPVILEPLREKAAEFAGIAPERIVHALVTEYMPGTPIGWHRDMPPFDKVIGVSFGSLCMFRMRREIEGKWERYARTVEPRSVYLMEGPARYEWQHSIPPLEEARYSVTFRTVR